MKLSPAQAALWHAGESAISSTMITLIIGVWQQLATGATNWGELFTIFGGGFVAALGLVYKSVLASPDLKQAEEDTAEEVKNFLSNEFSQFVNSHFAGVAQRFSGLESLLANHTHAQLPSALAPSQPPPFPVASTSTGVVPQVPTRSWNDSALMPIVLPKTEGK